MVPTRGSAVGKIILSGEYAVVFGEPGIAVPSTLRTEVTWDDDESPLAIGFSGILPKKAESYIRNVLSLCGEARAKPVTGKVGIQNEIPLGKGMGSSTAIVIAVCRAIFGPSCYAQALAIEDAVNPGHSGLDFAVIWNERPILFQKGAPLQEMALPADALKGALLVDTGTPNETTADLVAWVRGRELQARQHVEAIGRCTRRLIAGEPLPRVMRDHARAQEGLGVVTPEAQRLIALVQSTGGTAKVLGAGARSGGCGMVLVLPNGEMTLAMLREAGYPVIEATRA